MKFKPEEYFTAPRDAFKLHKCSGKIRISHMYVEGVRMDGQNMHSNFDNCGNTARYNARGCIGIKSSGLPGPNNQNIRIENCTFQNSNVGIDIHDARLVFVKNCKYHNIASEICIENSTSDEIYIDSDKIVGESGCVKSPFCVGST